jgi:hypothetical protein
MLHMAVVIRQTGGAGDKVVTRSVQWRKEASSLHTDRGVKELSTAFRALVSEERLAGTTVRIALGGEFCVTRVVTGPSEDVRREFAELEERSLRYLTLGPGPKALAGNVQQLDARHQYALLTVANQKTLDVLMSIAESVNLRIEAIEPSLIALSRTQAYLPNGCQDACLLIRVDEGAELGICYRGRLLLDYRPGGKVNADNVAGVVALHLSRLERYLQRYHSYLNAPLNRVYITGDNEAVKRAQRKFAELPQLAVEVLDPSDLQMNWQHVAEPPGTNLAAALGTALMYYPVAAEHQAPNLIASTLAELRAPLRPILLRALAPIATMIIVAAGLLMLCWSERRAAAGLSAELEALAPACTRATELRLKLAAAEAKLTQLGQLDRRLPQLEWQQVLSRISQSMPDDVWLDRLTIRDSRSAALTGASFTDGGVYDFVANLKQVPDIAEIALEGTGVGQSPSGATTNFDLELTLAELADPNGSEDRHD